MNKIQHALQELLHDKQKENIKGSEDESVVESEDGESENDEEEGANDTN